MGINTNGKSNYIRNLSDVYSQTFAKNYLDKINISIDDTNSIKMFLENQRIKGALIGINYIWNKFSTNNLEEKGYYSFYFFTDEKEQFNHGIVLEILNYKIDEKNGHIFQQKQNDNFITYYGLDYDQYLFQRASMALIETKSEIFEKNTITLNKILKYLNSKFEEFMNPTLIDLSKNLCISVCEYLNLYSTNIYNIISDKKAPKGKEIISKKILEQLNKITEDNGYFSFLY